jgi:PAS domain S-box-containing protein
MQMQTSPPCEEIASAWEQAIAGTGYVALSSAQVHERLVGWVEQLRTLVGADELDLEAAQRIGAGIARLYYGHPSTLSATLKVLGSTLPTLTVTEQDASVASASTAVLSELAAGFLTETRGIILSEQEMIRNALLTSREETQEALRESEARFRALFEAAAIGIGIGDMQGQILDANPALQRLLGYSAEEMRQHRVSDFMHPDDIQNIWRMYQELVTGQRDYFEDEKQYLRKDGHSVWTHLTVSLVRDANGVPQLQIAMMENVTQRKQAEETIKRLNADLERRVLERTAQLSALNKELADEIARRSTIEAERMQLLARAQAAQAEAEAAQQRLAFLAEASSELAASLDYKTTLGNVARLAVPYLGDWCAVDATDEVGELHRLAVAHVDLTKVDAVRALDGHYPVRADALSGVGPVLESLAAEFLPEMPEALVRNVPAQEGLQALMRELQPRARITVPLIIRERAVGAITFVLADSGRPYTRDDLGVADDLARRAALAIESARLYRDAQVALAMRDEFLSVAAHELKTPITSLRGFAELTIRAIDRGGELDRERLRQALTVVDTQSQKLTRLVSQLLDVSRIQAGKLTLNYREADLSQLVADVVADAEHRATGHSFSVRAPASVPVEVDTLRIEQVITNLLDNAIKFSPDGTRIDVDLETNSSEPLVATVVVRDRGMGIPSEQRERIFERFYQTQSVASPHAGMGLGLYISRQILELHGGRIWVDSPDDGGARFVLSLPLRRAAVDEELQGSTGNTTTSD